MRSIDIHAHLTPQCFIRAMQTGKAWHGIQPGTMRIAPRAIWTPEQRLADMHSLGVDVHVVSTGAAFYYYDGDTTTTAAMHRECNDEVHRTANAAPVWRGETRCFSKRCIRKNGIHTSAELY